MDPAGLHSRLATPGDRAALATFPCASADARVETWIRRDALARQLLSPPSDVFRLLVFHEDAGGLVAVSAHERNFVVADGDGDPLPGSNLILVAITDRFRDGRAPDGRPLVSVVLEAVLDDIQTRARGEWVAMMVRPGNNDGMGVMTRLGATRVGESEEDEVFLLRFE